MSPFRWVYNIVLIMIGFGLMLFVLDTNGYFDRALDQANTEAGQEAQAQASQSTRNYDEIVLQRDRSGHFWVEAYVDDEPILFIVDTGATDVVLSEADAERVGIDLWDDDFIGTARTANGIARFAPVLLDEINIDDSIIVRDVHGAVIEGGGSISLLGMSFLNQLSGFEVNGDEMILKP